MPSNERQRGSAGGRCPICKAPTEAAYRPFCSARCRDVDLARWLRGSYAIPGAEPEEGVERPTARDGDVSGEETDED